MVKNLSPLMEKKSEIESQISQLLAALEKDYGCEIVNIETYKEYCPIRREVHIVIQ